MSESLVIRLDPAPCDTATWVAVDATGALLDQPAAGPLSAASPAAAGRQVIALLPALEVLRTSAEVPLKAGSRLLQVLPFALEEQLAADVDELHFAAGSRDEHGRVPVAVVRRDAMAAWTRRLDEAGIDAAHAYCESDAVGAMPNTATLLVQADGAVLTAADGSATPLDCDNLDAVLELWVSQQLADASVPLHLVVYGTPAMLAPFAPTWERLQARLASLDVRGLAEGALPRLAARIVTSPGIDLLQGEFARRAGLAGFWPAWRLSTALAAALALLALGVQLLETSRLGREAARLDGTIDQAFHHVFPDAGPVADARTELSARLQQLGQQGVGGPHEFLDVLRVVGQAVQAENQARIEGLSYRPGTLELRLRAPNVEALDRIQQGVTQSGGVRAQIQSANSVGDQVVGRLQITRAGG